MTAQELRVGNWVSYRDKRNVTVSNLGDYFQTVDQNGIIYGSDDIRDYEPITLTHEILEKAGFNKIGDYNLKGIVYEIDNTDFWEYKSQKIKYLHQLQNLYFALTGEELNINL